MHITGKNTGRAMSMPAGLALGALLSVCVTVLGVALIAKMVDIGKMAESNVGYGVMVTLLTAAFVGARMASVRIKRQKMAVCGLSGGIYFLILLSFTALFFGGTYEAVGVTAALVMSGALAAALLGNASNGRRNGRRLVRINR